MNFITNKKYIDPKKIKDWENMPIRECSVEEATHNLMMTEGWVDVHRYAPNNSIINQGEIGILNGIRYKEVIN